MILNLAKRAAPTLRGAKVTNIMAPGSVNATRGILQSILHGSKEAKEVGDLEVQQHSKLVARGKYLHGFESAYAPSPLPFPPQAGDKFKLE